MSRPVLQSPRRRPYRLNSMHSATSSRNDSRDVSPSANNNNTTRTSHYSSLNDALVPTSPPPYSQNPRAVQSLQRHPSASEARTAFLQEKPMSSGFEQSNSPYQAPYVGGHPPAHYASQASRVKPPSTRSQTPQQFKSPPTPVTPYGDNTTSPYAAHPPPSAVPSASSSWGSSNFESEAPIYGHADQGRAVQPLGIDRASHQRPRPREREVVQTRGPRPANPHQQLNYTKIMRCYSDIMATAAQEPAPGQLSVLAELMQPAAAAGLRLLDSTEDLTSASADKKAKPLIDESSRAQAGSSPPSSASTPATPGQTKRAREVKNEGQVCKGCDATSTPEWRRGPLGPRTLCNACGLVYAKILKRRTREANGRRHTTRERQGADSSDGEGSEMDSTESPRSD